MDSILKSKRNDFEVVILDNCSDDGTEEYYKSFTDTRVKYFRNKVNIGGIKNPIKAVSLGKGLYSMVILDKDKIDGIFWIVLFNS